VERLQSVGNVNARALRAKELFANDLADNIAHGVRWHDATTVLNNSSSGTNFLPINADSVMPSWLTRPSICTCRGRTFLRTGPHLQSRSLGGALVDSVQQARLLRYEHEHLGESQKSSLTKPVASIAELQKCCTPIDDSAKRQLRAAKESPESRFKARTQSPALTPLDLASAKSLPANIVDVQ
jgi:hypothetical protein